MQNTIVNAAGRLDRLPICGFHWRLLALIGAGMFCDGLDSYIAGGVLGAVTKSGWSDLVHNAHFVSATFIGMTIGAFIAGIMGDRLGRRMTYQVNLLIFGLASLAGAAAPSMDWLIAARLIMGIGIGAEVVAGYVTLGEFVPPQQRGRWVGALAVITNSALFFSSVIGAYIIPAFGWRWMFGLVGVLSLVVWLFRRRLPESPRWLESKGRLEEAEIVLGQIEAEARQGGELPAAQYHPTPVLPQQPFSQLFTGALLARTLVGSTVVIGISTALYGFIAWLPTFFVKQGLGIGSSLAFTAVMTFGSPLGNFFAMWLSGQSGRRASLMAFGVAAATLGVIYPYATSATQVVVVGFLLVFCIGVLIGIGWALYVPELFPTELRMRGAGTCNTAGRLVSIITPYGVIALFGLWGVSGVVFTLSGILVVMVLMVAFLGVETSRRTLEELRPDDLGQVGQAALADGAAE